MLSTFCKIDLSFRRVRDKYEAEFRELEHSERQTKERYNQMKSQMTEVEGRTLFSGEPKFRITFCLVFLFRRKRTITSLSSTKRNRN